MDVEKKMELKSPKLHTQGPPGTCQGGLREYARPPKTAKNQGILILRAHVSPHLGAEAWAQVVVALTTRRSEPNNPHLRTREPTGQPSPQNLVPLPQSCEGPSECNEATRLGLQCEGTPPQCNGSLFTRRLADPQSPKDGRQLACPPLTGKD